MEFTVGSEGRKESMVTEEVTAAACGSGLLPVFSTPSLVALMEGAACACIEAAGGGSSVGTRIDVRHEAATPLGMKVWAVATLREVDRRRLGFTVEAFDETGRVGVAEHDRFLVDPEKFMAKVEAKRG